MQELIAGSAIATPWLGGYLLLIVLAVAGYRRARAAKRKRRRATVSAQELPGAVQAKFGAAVSALRDMRDAESPRMLGGRNPGDSVTAFLESARGVYYTVETFGQAALTEAGFAEWFGDWTSDLRRVEHKLWDFMARQRSNQIHGAGLDVVAVEIPLDSMDQWSGNSSALFGHSTRGTASKGGIRFRAYRDRPVSDVCAEYLPLMQRFYDDFRTDHTALL